LKSEESIRGMITKEEYQDKVEAEIREWSSRIYILKVEVERQQGKEKPEHRRRIVEILDQIAELEEMIEELKKATGKKWIEVKDRVQEAQADLEDSFKTSMLEII
jgi:hypothetical protein